jgi:hypothetical protein
MSIRYRSPSVRSRAIRHACLAAGLCAALLLPGSPTAAQTASAPVVTAAFLLNFAKFTDWPADVLAPDAPLVICVADATMAEAVSTAVAGKMVGTHQINVMRVSSDQVPRTCGVLYVTDLDARRTDAIVAAMRGMSVLSVSNSEEFTRRGGVAHLYLADGSMRFAVNVAAAERARLRLSSRLLSLARIVKE